MRARKVIKIQHSDSKLKCEEVKRAKMIIQRLNTVVPFRATIDFHVKFLTNLIATNRRNLIKNLQVPGVSRLYQLVVQTWLGLFDEEGLIDGSVTFAPAAFEHLKVVDGNTFGAAGFALGYMIRYGRASTQMFFDSFLECSVCIADVAGVRVTRTVKFVDHSGKN